MSLSDRIQAAMHRGAMDGLIDVARELKRRSDRDLPVGDPAEDPDPSVSLEESGYIDVDRARGVVTVGYRGPYAAFQHENRHLKHPRGGKSQFLEDQVKAMFPRIDGIVAAEVRKNVKRS